MSLKDAAEFALEIWLLYGVAVVFTGLRMGARFRSVGWRNLQADDCLACVALIFYSAQTAIAYRGSKLYYTWLAMGALLGQSTAPPSPEAIQVRITGAKLHFSMWPMYSSTLWLLKASLLVLYRRLTTSLQGHYRSRVLFGFVLLFASWAAVQLTLFLACRPFSNYFAEKPTGGNACMPAISKPIVWTCYAFNVATDLYLISLPMPMLWESTMKTWKKFGLGLLFSGGFLVIAFATVRCVLLTTSKGNASPVAAAWSIRESFVAVITANLPMAFTLVKGMLGPAFRSTGRTNGTLELNNTSRKSLRTFGSDPSGRIRGGPGVDPTATQALFSASEERIYNEQLAQQGQHLSSAMPVSSRPESQVIHEKELNHNPREMA